jgi:hypothetical protein
MSVMLTVAVSIVVIVNSDGISRYVRTHLTAVLDRVTFDQPMLQACGPIIQIDDLRTGIDKQVAESGTIVLRASQANTLLAQVRKAIRLVDESSARVAPTTGRSLRRLSATIRPGLQVAADSAFLVALDGAVGAVADTCRHRLAGGGR